MTWDLVKLRQEVKATHGEPQFQKLDSCLNSVAERQEFARFHFHQAEEAIGLYLDGNMKVGELLSLFLSSGTPNRQVFNTNRTKAKAHIHACLQNMHCVADVMSHVIYFSLALNNARTEAQISLKNVCCWIETRAQYSALVNLLKELTDDDDYRYLEAIVNHSKHRSIIEADISLDLRPGEPSPVFKFRHFVHKGLSYGERSVREYLTEEFSRHSRLIVDIGNEINHLVES